MSECGVGDLLAFERREQIVDYVADLFDRLRRAERSDVLARSENQPPVKVAAR